MPIGRILQLGFQRYQYAGHPRRLQNRTIASEAPDVATGTQALRPDVAAHCHW